MQYFSFDNEVPLFLQFRSEQMQKLSGIDPLLVSDSDFDSLKHCLFFNLSLLRKVSMRLKLANDKGAECLEMLAES